MGFWEDMAAQGIYPQSGPMAPKDYFPKDEMPANDGLLEVFGKSLVHSFLNVGKGIVGTAERQFEKFGISEPGGFVEQARKNIEKEAEKFVTTTDTATEWVARAVAETLPYMGTTFVAGLFGGPLAAMGVGYMVEGQNAYEAAIKRGAGEDMANKERAVVGGINALIEGLQISRLMKFSKTGKTSFKAFKNAAIKRAWGEVARQGGKLTTAALKNSLEEAIEEFAQEGVSIYVPYFFEGKQSLPLKPDGSIDYMATLSQMAEAGLGAAVASPFLGLGKAAVTGFASPSDTRIDNLRKAGLKNRDLTAQQKGILLSELKKMENYSVPLATASEVGLSIKKGEVDIPELQRLTPEQREAYLKILPSQIRAGVEKKSKMAKLSPAVRQITEINSYVNLLDKFYNSMDTWLDNLKSKRKLENLLYDQFTPGEINSLFEAIRLAPEYTRQKHREFAAKALGELLRKRTIPTVGQARSLRPVLGSRLVDKMIDLINQAGKKKTPLLKRALRGTAELINVPKALKASVDFSGSLRQGFFMMFTDPKAWAEGVTAGYRAFADPEFAKFMNIVLESNPLFGIAENSGVFKSEIGQLTRTEEYFVNSLAGKIPGVKASERAYVTALNTMRHQAFYHVVEGWIGKGVKSQKDYKDLAQMLNHMTGRGNIKALKKYMPLLNIMFFSPSFTMGQLQLIKDVLPHSGEPLGYNPARRVVAAGLVEAVGTGILILMLLKHLKGVKVEHDPRSTDFGKIQIGDTRIDFWAGYSQIARLVVGMATGDRKTTGTGDIIPADRLDIALRFLQTKLSPVAGLAVDYKRKQDFKGNIIELDAQGITNQAVERLVPLFLQDVADVIRYQGLGSTAALTSGLALHGVGVMTYPETESTKLQKLKNHYAQNTHGVKWDNLGEMAQSLLKIHYPLIEEQEHRVFEEQLHKPVRVRHMEEIRKSERDLVKSLPESVQVELKRLLVDVGGLSRKIGSDWYLNDKRYKEYRDKVSEQLNEWLPGLISMDINPILKRQFIEYMIGSIKKSIRNDLIFNADMEDLREGRI